MGPIGFKDLVVILVVAEFSDSAKTQTAEKSEPKV
jgi:hypothetical protein